jgi:hypothetical protein
MLAEAAVAIHLICAGGGTENVGRSSVITSTNGMSAPVVVNSTSHVGYDDEVTIDLDSDTGRIRVPNEIKPRIRSGGDDGWWKLTDVKIGENEISAKFSLNFMNKPSLLIDRLSGHIAIQGKAGSFDGYCRPYDPTTVQRKF